MSPVTGLPRLPGRMSLSVHLGNFSPVDRDAIQERKLTKMVEHKLVSFATIVRFCRYHFCRYVAIAKLFCQKMFRPGHPG